MLPTSGAISINDIEVELGISSGTKYSIADLLALMTSLGGYHSSDTFSAAYGYAHGSIRHYMQVTAVIDQSYQVRLTVYNYQTDNGQTGTLYWSIYDSGYSELANGSDYIYMVAPSSTYYLYCAYYSGTPYYVAWGWSPSYKTNYVII